MKPREHYQALFAPLVASYGPLDEGTITGVIGFSAGGPVSLCTIERRGVIVTCELSLYPEQRTSAEGLKYEFLSLGQLDVETTRQLFTAIGALSMTEMLGDGHTIDVARILPDLASVIRLRLFSRTRLAGQDFGIYEVLKEKGSIYRDREPHR